MKKTLIIIPTYNEIENIPDLLKNIEKLDETDTRVETLSVIPQDDANTTVSKILISEKAGSYQTKLSTISKE